jgi:uncharacterized protein (DUF608 family)
MGKARPYAPRDLYDNGRQRTFDGTEACQIALPMGGIGAGCICLNGIGGLQDFSIRNRPDNSALPDGHRTLDAAFALLHVKGRRPVTRLVEGPFPPEKVYAFGLKNQGYRVGGHEGLPRFAKATFRGEYPFGYVTLTDRDVPLRVRITGWSPFIPLDDVNSGIPCAILEYTFENRSKRKVDFEFSYHLSHLAPGSLGPAHTLSSAIRGAGVHFTNEDDPAGPASGSASLSVVGHRPVIKAMWFRGGWFDSVSALWREVSTGSFRPNSGSNGVDTEGRNGGSILMRGSLQAGRSVTFPIVVTWHFPNCYTTAGRARTDDCGCADGSCQPAWRPFYASQWQDAAEVARHVRDNYATLRVRTQEFHDALFSSTLPSYVLDAVSANLAILKSPTVLRQENGNVWAWEGCFCEAGCCPGSCTHVWNYAQAMPHLFPRLERTLREQELERSMDHRGHVTFRSALPDGPTGHGWHAAADGQLGGIMKAFREWQISGDAEWLAKMYPLARRSMDFCIEQWDPDRKGVLVEPHHNTYDIEFWGPDGMCSSIYIGALSAMALMCEEMGDDEDGAAYRELAQRGAEYLDERLFNGRYYEQHVQWQGLRDTSFAEMIADVDARSSEVMRLLKKEGPKYQYGKGCMSDGVIGQWMASTYGIETPLQRAHVRRHLRSIFAYNFRHDLTGHACLQRPGYAWGAEPGLLVCSWPRGDKPTLPFVYSDEVWTGMEYHVAAHLIMEGGVAEGLTIVKAARSRYDGRTRNPWNEYECGSYYARAMSSYALLGALSGFGYSAVSRTLHFGPKPAGDRFRVFFSTAGAWGTVTLSRGRLTVRVTEGELAVDEVVLESDGRRRRIPWGVTVAAGKRRSLRVER